MAEGIVKPDEIKYNIFLSYDSLNKKQVLEFYEFLKSEGLIVWIDKHKMSAGKINELMRDGVVSSALFLCCLTENYPKRENCMKELRIASAYKKTHSFCFIRPHGHELHRLA